MKTFSNAALRHFSKCFLEISKISKIHLEKQAHVWMVVNFFRKCIQRKFAREIVINFVYKLLTHHQNALQTVVKELNIFSNFDMTSVQFDSFIKSKHEKMKPENKVFFAADEEAEKLFAQNMKEFNDNDGDDGDENETDGEDDDENDTDGEDDDKNEKDGEDDDGTKSPKQSYEEDGGEDKDD